MGRRLVAVFVVMLVLAATAAAGTPLTHAQFVAKAKAICAKGAAASKTLGAPASSEGWARYFSRLAAIDRSEVAGIGALAAPAADKASVGAMLRYLNELIAVENRMEAAEKKMEAGGAAISMNKMLAQGTALFGKAVAAAKKLGITLVA